MGPCLAWRKPLKVYWGPLRKSPAIGSLQKARRLIVVVSRESKGPHTTLTRTYTPYSILHDFDLAKAEGYQQQYGDLYFLRLAKLKPAVEQVAQEAWSGYQVRLISRVSQLV